MPSDPIEQIQVVDQPIRVGGDAQQPLPQGEAHYRIPAALALAINDLLVGQHRAQLRAPVDGHLGLIGQPVRVLVAAYRLGAGVGDLGRDRQLGNRPPPLRHRVVPGVVDLQEDPLRPADVLRVGGVYLPLPIVAQAQRLDLAAEGVDVLGGGEARVRPGLDGVLLGGQAERIPAHRVQHMLAAHPLIAGENIGGGVAFDMADVQPVTGGVGEHVQDVELAGGGRGQFVGIGAAEGALAFPVCLPAGFDLLRSVVRHVRFRMLRSSPTWIVLPPRQRFVNRLTPTQPRAVRRGNSEGQDCR
jgi:hypothetical protein